MATPRWVSRLQIRGYIEAKEHGNPVLHYQADDFGWRALALLLHKHDLWPVVDDTQQVDLTDFAAQFMSLEPEVRDYPDEEHDRQARTSATIESSATDNSSNNTQSSTSTSAPTTGRPAPTTGRPAPTTGRPAPATGRPAPAGTSGPPGTSSNRPAQAKSRPQRGNGKSGRGGYGGRANISSDSDSDDDDEEEEEEEDDDDDDDDEEEEEEEEDTAKHSRKVTRAGPFIIGSSNSSSSDDEADVAKKPQSGNHGTPVDKSKQPGYKNVLGAAKKVDADSKERSPRFEKGNRRRSGDKRTPSEATTTSSRVDRSMQRKKLKSDANAGEDGERARGTPPIAEASGPDSLNENIQTEAANAADFGETTRPIPSGDPIKTARNNPEAKPQTLDNDVEMEDPTQDNTKDLANPLINKESNTDQHAGLNTSGNTSQEQMETSTITGASEKYRSTDAISMLPNRQTIHAWDLVAASTPTSHAKPTHRKVDILVGDGKKLEMNEKLGKEVDTMVKSMYEHISGMKNVKERPSKPKNNPLHNIDIENLLEGDTNRDIPDPFHSMAGFEERVASIRSLMHDMNNLRLKNQFIESYFGEIVIARARENNPSRALTNRQYKMALDQTKFADHTGHSEVRVAERMRLWKVLSELRKKGGLTLILFRTPSISRWMKTLKGSTDWLALSVLLHGIFKRMHGRIFEIARGDIRGLSEIPDELHHPDLVSKWSASCGRWSSLLDAFKFSQLVGVPEVRNNLLSTEACYEYGWMGIGHGDNAMPFTALFQTTKLSGGRSVEEWRCFSTVGSAPGTFYGFVPHVTSYVDDTLPKHHDRIYARHENVTYASGVLIGALSFVEFVSDRKLANVAFASDVYCDTILPDHYSLRVGVFAIREIFPMEILRVYIGGLSAVAGQGQINRGLVKEATELNKRFQQMIISPREVAAPEVGTLGSGTRWPTFQHAAQMLMNVQLSPSVDEELMMRLSHQYFEPNLVEGPSHRVEVSAADFQTMRAALVFDQPAHDAMDKFREAYDAHNKMRVQQKPPTAPLQISILQYSLIAAKATALQIRTKRTQKESAAVTDARQMDRGPLVAPAKPIQAGKGLSTPKADGHFASAVQLLYSITPLEALIKRGHWVKHFPQHDREVGSTASFSMDKNGTRTTDQVLDILDALFRSFEKLFRAMSNAGGPAVVDESVVQAALGKLDDALGIEAPTRSNEPRASAQNIRHGSDVHETYTRLHGMLLEVLLVAHTGLRPTNLPPSIRHLTRSQETKEKEDAARAVQEQQRRAGRVPLLLGMTSGIVHEVYKCAAHRCGQLRHQAYTPFSELTVPLEEGKNVISLAKAIQKCYGSDAGSHSRLAPTPNQCSTPDCGETAMVSSTELVLTPDYLLVNLVRVEDGVAEVQLADMVVDLRPCSAKLEGEIYVYDIVATVELRAAPMNADGTADGEMNYVCYALRGKQWFLFHRSVALPRDATDVDKHPSEVRQVLLHKRLRPASQ